jgi:hypothetical protein
MQLFLVLKTPRRSYREPGYIPSWVMWRFYYGQTGGEILSIRVHRDEREDRYGLFLVLVLFRLVVPPLQLGVVESYQVWGV